MNDQNVEWAQGKDHIIRRLAEDRDRWCDLATKRAMRNAELTLENQALLARLTYLEGGLTEQRPSPEGLHAQKLKED